LTGIEPMMQLIAVQITVTL